MRNTKRSIQSAVTIDGVPLIWQLHREQQWCDEDQWTGLSIHVKVTNAVRRDLFLEYPAVPSKKIGLIRTDPVRPTITTARVAVHIREAIVAGWDPESRGKPFVYQVADLPS